jgi:riboflavin kinase/FMN adenylyltransferase
MDVTWLPDAQFRPRHVAVGEFDGVHLGHREVMRGADTVLTFEPHPRAVVAPDTAPKLITALETKADLIAGLGVRELVVIPFDGAFASRSPQDFIDHVLVETLGAERVSAGENFRFGHRAKGDVALLRAQDAFETRVVELV